MPQQQSPDYSSYTKRIKTETRANISKDYKADVSEAKEARHMVRSTTGNPERQQYYAGTARIYERMAGKKARSLSGWGANGGERPGRAQPKTD